MKKTKNLVKEAKTFLKKKPVQMLLAIAIAFMLGVPAGMAMVEAGGGSSTNLDDGSTSPPASTSSPAPWKRSTPHDYSTHWNNSWVTSLNMNVRDNMTWGASDNIIANYSNNSLNLFGNLNVTGAGSGNISASSVDAEQLFTNSRCANIVIHKLDNGTYVADGPTGVIDSNTDITPVLQSALDWIPTGHSNYGALIELPRGQHTITSTINLPEAHWYIRGKGPLATELSLQANVDADMFKMDTDAFSGNINFAGFEMLKLAGNKNNNVGGCGINITGTSYIFRDIYFRRLFVNNFNASGIRIDRSKGYRIVDCLIETHGEYGLHWTDAGSGGGNYISNTYFAVNGKDGVYDQDIQNFYSNCFAFDNGDSGFWISGLHTKMTGCVGRANTDDAFKISGSDGTYSGITGRLNNNFNIHVYGSNNFISGYVYESPNDGLRFQSGSSNNTAIIAGSDNSRHLWSDVGTQNIVNGEVSSPESIDMGGSDAEISFDYLPVNTIPVIVDAGGAAVTIRGIDHNVASMQDIGAIKQKIKIVHTGGENITIDHNNPISTGHGIITQSGADVTLDSNGDFIVLVRVPQADEYRELYSST